MYCNSIADLLILNPIPPNTEFIVGGFYKPGDGGGGTFIWIDDQTNAGYPLLDNGIVFNRDLPNIINPTNQIGYFQRIFSGPINVRWFGAILGAFDPNPDPDYPNIIFDTTPYVHRARDSSAFADNGTLYFPKGEYPGAFVFSHKYQNIYIQGQGWEKTVLRNEINIVGDGWGTVLRSNGKTAIQGLLPEGYPILTLGITDYTHWRWRKVSNLRLDGMAILPGKGGNLPDTQHLTSTRTNHVTPLHLWRGARG